MKLLICTVLAFFFAFASAEEISEKGVKAGIADIINSTIADMLAQMPDPLDENDVVVDLGGASANSSIEGVLNVTTLHVTGISKIVASQCDLISVGLVLNMTIDVPDLLIQLKDYYMDLVIGNIIPLYGSGTINVELEGLRLYLTGKVKLLSLTEYQLNEVEASVDLDSANFDISGLINNVEFNLLLSSILNDVVVDFIQDYREAITTIISPIVEQVVNDILGGGLFIQNVKKQMLIEAINSLQ